MLSFLNFSEIVTLMNNGNKNHNPFKKEHLGLSQYSAWEPEFISPVHKFWKSEGTVVFIIPVLECVDTGGFWRRAGQIV